MWSKMKKVLPNWIVVFFVILIASITVSLIFLYDFCAAIKNDVSGVKDTLFGIQANQETVERDIVEENIYKDIDDKMESAISRLLTIVGITTGVFTFFSLLLAFKAPHDIDKRIDELKVMVDDVAKLSEERSKLVEAAKYQALISSAMAKEHSYDRIKKLNAIITKFPDRPDAYMERGFQFDEIKQFDRAIIDYEVSKTLGINLESYYNAMGVAYSNKKDDRKAITYYSKALEICPQDSDYLCNRACSYDEIGRFEDALDDYDKAIAIDPDCWEAYLNRSFTYDKLWRIEEDEEKKKTFIDGRKKDLEKAIQLNPQDEKAPKALKRFIRELEEKGIIVEIKIEHVVAKIDEKIGDLSLDNKEWQEAFAHYRDAHNYYATEYTLRDVSAYKADIDRLASKITNMLLNENVSIQLHPSDKTNPVLIGQLQSAGVDKYLHGEKDDAEVLFTSILPHASSALNLAFMKRRGEVKRTNLSVDELLEMHDDKESMVWCINAALCYILGPTSNNDWESALRLVNRAKDDVDIAVEWWSESEVVGVVEKSAALLLIALSSCVEADKFSIQTKIYEAENNGLVIPQEIKDKYQ